MLDYDTIDDLNASVVCWQCGKSVDESLLTGILLNCPNCGAPQNVGMLT